MSKIVLRPYQERGSAEIRGALRSHRAVLYCLPCGGGKGTLTSFMVESAVAHGKCVIFAVHGRALVHDMHERVARLGISHGVLMGGERRERHHQVQVSSIDTLHRMPCPPRADLIIIDEARTFMSETGRKALDRYPNAKIVGLDATPARLDGKGLGVEAGGLFDAMVMGPSEQELIDMGYLVPSIPIGTPAPPDTSQVKKTGGDYNQKELAEACDKVTLVGDIVEHWLREASDRKTIAFGVDQSHARHIKEQFCAAGVEWEYVDAKTPDAERQKIWDRLDNGSLMGISNVMIAGVGWDHPVISCIISARPTKSLSLWRQMMGRGSRIYPGKKDFKVLDHAGNFAEHFPYGFFECPPEWSLDGGDGKAAGKKKPNPVQEASCKIPVLVPPTGVPASFTGPLSICGTYMLPSFHKFVAGPDVCPYCGIPLEIAGGREVETEDGKLENLADMREAAKAEAKKKSPAQLAHDERMRLRYLELVKIGLRGRGDGIPYKGGWAAMALHSEFHRWPAKAWKEEAEKMMNEMHEQAVA